MVYDWENLPHIGAARKAAGMALRGSRISLLGLAVGNTEEAEGALIRTHSRLAVAYDQDVWLDIYGDASGHLEDARKRFYASLPPRTPNVADKLRTATNDLNSAMSDLRQARAAFDEALSEIIGISGPSIFRPDMEIV